MPQFSFAILLTLLLASCTTLPTPNFQPQENSLKVVTYNINWGGGNSPVVPDTLLASKADIIFLQETHPEWERFLKKRIGKKYPHTFFHHPGAAGGIGYMSKVPLKNIQVIPSTHGWFPALLATTKTKLGEVQLVNVHLRPPLSDSGSATLPAYYNSPRIHQRELADFLRHTTQDMPLIIAGDFNEGEKRAAVKNLTNNGFTDALSIFDKKSKTWSWKLFPGFRLSGRYDHVLTNNHLQCTGAKVIDIRASDHRPVVATLVRRNTL